jgi:thioredoxin:protein disulfide reductase
MLLFVMLTPFCVGISFMLEELALQFEMAVHNQSFFTFPVLILAGVLTNLTPCVYPMIPITLNVMTHIETRIKGFHAKTAQRKAGTFYALGILCMYLTLGIVFGATGILFGSHLSKPWVQMGLAFIFFLLGIGLLKEGIFLGWIQNFANRLSNLPLPQAYSAFAFGCLAGFTAAPCTGPVLASLLVFISQQNNIFTSLVFMFFYAFGFALPYFILSFMYPLPKFKRFAFLFHIKIIFACFMFALGIFYLKGILLKWDSLTFLYTKPPLILFIASLVIGAYLSTRHHSSPSRAPSYNTPTHNNTPHKKVSPNKTTLYKASLYKGLALFVYTGVCLWITLFLNKGFLPTQASGLPWLTSWSQATRQAYSDHKPLLFYFRADWCEACQHMEQEVWSSPEMINTLSTHFVLMKWDVTQPNSTTTHFLNRWNIYGLPAIGVFEQGKTLEPFPHKKIFGFLSLNELKQWLKPLFLKE